MRGKYSQSIINALSVLIFLSVTACIQQQNQNNSNTTSPIVSKLPVANITLIQYGYYAGECAGYCNQEMSVTSENVTLKKNSFTDDKKQYPDYVKTVPFTKTEWNNLVSILNIEKIKALPDRIGCPDCADGGAEWIAITENNVVKKVLFDAGKKIEGIELITEKLRSLKEKFN